MGNSGNSDSTRFVGLDAEMTPASAGAPDSAAFGDGRAPDVATDPAQRRWILVATCLGLLAVMMAVSGLNVAQQALATDLGASQGELLWIINGFTVALAATLLPLGALGDRLGRKVLLVAGLVAFAGLNVAAALAGDPMMLIVIRVLIGISAAMIMPTTLSTITAAFPAAERGRAIGVWTGVAGGGSVIGLIASSILIDIGSWRWSFAAPLFVAVVAIAVTIPKVPNTREAPGGRFDLGGSFLSIAAVGGVVLAIHEGPEQGWTAPITLIAGVTGVLGVAAFVLWEGRQSEPLLDVSVFSNRTLSAGALSLTVMFALIIGMFLVMIQFLQAILGFSALRSSIALMPMIAMLMMAAPVAPAIAKRIGYRASMTASLAVVGGALGWLALLPADPTYVDVLPALFILGSALGVAMTPSTTAITESLPADKQGVASALNDTVRELGGAIGVALIGSVLASEYRSSIGSTADMLDPELGQVVEEGIGGAYVVAAQIGADGQDLIASAQLAFLDGWATSMWIAAGIAVATSAVAFLLIPKEDSVKTGSAA